MYVCIYVCVCVKEKESEKDMIGHIYDHFSSQHCLVKTWTAAVNKLLHVLYHQHPEKESGNKGLLKILEGVHGRVCRGSDQQSGRAETEGQFQTTFWWIKPPKPPT